MHQRQIRKSVQDFIDGCDDKIQRQIIKHICILIEHPFYNGTKQLMDCPPFEGNPVRRMKCGAYRILYTFDKTTDTVCIFGAGLRRDMKDLYPEYYRTG